MNNSMSKILKRVIPIVCLMLLLASYFFITGRPPKGTTDIIDDDTPLASLTEAYFYVAKAELDYNNPSSFTLDDFLYVGKGTVMYDKDIYNNPAAVSNALIASPDIDDYVNFNQTIEWNTIYKFDKYILVGGRYVDTYTSHSTVEAEFYLFDQQSSDAVFTNVSPEIAEYVGHGLYDYDNDYYNSPDDVHSHIISEPSYNSPDGMYIKWGSAYKYEQKLIVVGAYATGTKPDYSPDIVQDDSEEIITDVVVETPEEESENNKKYDDESSVLYYGAIGDGKTDDTAAFKTALSKMAGKTLYIPSGTYLISERLSIPSNTTVVGDGNKSIIMATPGKPIGSDLVKISEKKNITLSNITLSGNIEHNTREMGHSDKDGIHLLEIWHSNKITITDCFFIDNVYTAIRVVQDCSSIYIDHCSFINVDCGLITLGEGSLDSLTVTNSVFDGHLNSECVAFGSTGNYTNINISDNIMKNKTYGTAINLVTSPNYSYTKHGSIDGLRIANNQLYDDAAGITVYFATNAEIYGNTINFSGNLGGGGKGINLQRCNSTVVHDNNVSNTDQMGFYIKDCVSTEIYGNTITDCGFKSTDFHAIDLRGTCSDLKIHNNTIERTNNSLSEYFIVSHCDGSGSTQIVDNTMVNSKILLYTDSTNNYVSKNGASVLNRGQSNTIVN